MTANQVSHDSRLIDDRWIEVQHRALKAGAHQPDEDAMCVMEAVAYVAGEPWSDHPQCVCPTIAVFLGTWNDGLPSDDDRIRLLRPLIPRLIGSRASAFVEERRGWMALDWMIRVNTPAWLEIAGLADHARALRELREIVDLASLKSADAPCRTAASAASAAWSARAASDASDASDAWAALKPTVEQLQQSALDLVDRMLAVTDAEMA